jgi:hypothetical protein
MLAAAEAAGVLDPPGQESGNRIIRRHVAFNHQRLDAVGFEFFRRAPAHAAAQNCPAVGQSIHHRRMAMLLAVAGCFLPGCCGSPMLPIYLSLLGPWFLPWAKPLSAILTALSILLGIWWIRRKTAQVPCADPQCACNRSGAG